jgi:hypothetical protein
MFEQSPYLHDGLLCGLYSGVFMLMLELSLELVLQRKITIHRYMQNCTSVYSDTHWYLSLYRTLWRNAENLPYLCPSDTLWVSSIIRERSRRGALATTLRSDCSALSFRS